MFGDNEKRENLPALYEKKYASENLKEKIADIGMWGLIPAVTGSMDSKYGRQRLKENDILFSFIDRYFANDPFAFEPNMRDGRFVFLPDDVGHQGIGVCASKDFPGFLEIGHFWYPREFTGKTLQSHIDQVYVPIFSVRPETALADNLRKIYMEENPKHQNYCTFPFSPELTVRLTGNFLDRINQSTRTIRDALKFSDQQTRRNGEGLIEFMQSVIK